jgi:hypothetical protein
MTLESGAIGFNGGHSGSKRRKQDKQSFRTSWVLTEVQPSVRQLCCAVCRVAILIESYDPQLGFVVHQEKFKHDKKFYAPSLELT